MLVVAAAGYRLSPPPNAPVLQGRYLLPLIPVYATLIALAVRGAGWRLGPAAAVAIVFGAVAHNVAGLMLTIAR